MTDYYKTATSPVECPGCGKMGLKGVIAPHAENKQDELHRNIDFDDVW